MIKNNEIKTIEFFDDAGDLQELKLKHSLTTERRAIIYLIRAKRKISTSEFETWCNLFGKKSTDRRRREVTEMGFLHTRRMTAQEKETHRVAGKSNAGNIYEYVSGSLEAYSTRRSSTAPTETIKPGVEQQSGQLSFA